MAEKIMRTYYVWPTFPSVSITGTKCALNCLHCGRKYLSHMQAAETPDKFIELCLREREKGARGVLISGGCDKKGRMLNLDKFLPAIKDVKEKTDLIIKLHTGFVDADLARRIVEAGVDVASMEFVGADESIHDIFGLDARISDYVDTFVNLKDAGMQHIAPHIAVGLHFGKLKGEARALELLKESKIAPSTLVIIVFRPTKGTALADLPAPSPEDVGTVVKRAKTLFPNAPLVLGSLRPRSSGRNDPDKEARYGIERAAIDNGITGIEIPSLAAIEYLKERGYRIKRINAYGVLPIEYEDKVEWVWGESTNKTGDGGDGARFV